MKCPNCGYPIQNGMICPNCGVDAFIFKKTRNASIRFYNKGLEQAKVRDLTGAEKSLEQSVLFDKNNYIARNLLGLVYHEKGQIADALKHWIVSASIHQDNNPASYYIETLRKDGRKMEKKNDAVRFYNQAISYLQQGSDDLALIQLKRALDYNKNFVEACNLMTLCCLQEKNFDRASYFIQKVLKIDQYNPKALKYAQELNIVANKKQKRPVKNNADMPSVKRTDAAPPAPTYRRQPRSQNGFKNEIIAFLVGGVSVAIVLLSLVMPAMSETKDRTIDELRSKVSAAGNITSEELTELRQKLKTLEEENDKYKQEAAKQQNVTLLQEASTLAENGNSVEAAGKIVLIDSSDFSEEQKATLDTLKLSVLPQAASTLYTQGRGEFLNKNYDIAKESLEGCLKYASSEDFIDDAFYYLGQIAQEKNDTATAQEYYQRILNEYPNSNQFANAQNALEQLNNITTTENTQQNTTTDTTTN